MKKNGWLILLLAVFAIPLFPRLRAQQNQNPPPKSDMPGMDMGEMQRDTKAAPQAAASANEQMSDMHMDMGPHMHMTELRKPSPEDEQRAAQIVEKLRPAIEQYKDYHKALDDGFKIFGPDVPQEHYHFTNYRYAMEAQFTFNPAHPTSLLYKKVGDGYELEGAMYTAPKGASEEELNERVPLSVARWHKHVNLCMPQKGTELQQVNLKQFGFRGSISTEAACEQAGGVWRPQVFGWMVHVYPFESDPAKIWAH